MRTLTLFSCFCFFLPCAGAQESSPSRSRQAEANKVADYEPRTVLRKPIRPIVDPRIVSATEADVFDGELVIGVEVNGSARAYPINQLTGPQREIINDKLGGELIAATW